MKLIELYPVFLKRINDKTFQQVSSIGEADGIEFLCPVCFVKNGGSVGTHSIICWNPSVPQTTTPIPGRWNLVGTGFSDLTLTAGSSSVLLKDAPCGAHFHVTNGQIV